MTGHDGDPAPDPAAADDAPVPGGHGHPDAGTGRHSPPSGHPRAVTGGTAGPVGAYPRSDGPVPGRVPDALAASAAAVAEEYGPELLRRLAGVVAVGGGIDAVATVIAIPGFIDAARPVLDAAGGPGAAAYLRGVADGYARAAGSVTVESVWTGPTGHGVPVRATAQVLVELVGQARTDLALMTYSARPYEPLLAALAAAVGRGVAVTVVVETLSGAGSALAGTEPAAAFAAVPGITLLHWPTGRRAMPGAKMHAKLAVADRRLLLVSSANLTQSGVTGNIEAGLLIRGGTAPVRAAEHLADLRARDVLVPLT